MKSELDSGCLDGSPVEIKQIPTRSSSQVSAKCSEELCVHTEFAAPARSLLQMPEIAQEGIHTHTLAAQALHPGAGVDSIACSPGEMKCLASVTPTPP